MKQKVLIVLNVFLAITTLFSQKNTEEAVTKYSFEMFKQLALDNKSENLFFSPYSLSTAFALPYLGANDLTKTQLKQVFYYDNDKTKNLRGFSNLDKHLNQIKGVELTASNRIWLQEGMTLQPAFKSALANLGKSPVENINFTGNTVLATEQINRWVSQQTNGKINGLIPLGALNELTRFVITNTIYFKGSWANRFDSKLTATKGFNTIEGSEMPTAFMVNNNRDKFLYFEDNEVQIVELPYTEKDVSMIVILPRFADKLGDLEQSLTLNQLQGWLKNMKEREVILTLPKFTITDRFDDLKASFRKMGLTEPFRTQGGFDGITNSVLHISKVIHQAGITVNEEGTEATASTAVIGVLKGLSAPPAVFNASHPFLFFIQDKKTNTILFMGRLAKPNYSDLATYDTPSKPTAAIETTPENTTEIQPDIITKSVFHEVKAGESLYGIAKTYGISVDKLKTYNELNSNTIKVGQKLALFEKNTPKAAPKPVFPSTPPAVIATTTVETPETPEKVVHVVSKGETLYRIAQLYDTKVQLVKSMNDLKSDVLHIGQKILIREGLKEGEVIATNEFTYKVKSGDTLYKIARKYNTSVSELRKNNNLTSDLLQIGDELKVTQ